MRSEFQRDRDRVVHCSAFRRLVYKTQVFLNHEGDLFRTRLTHSLEVAQLARSIARALRLEEDLVEAIALAHDLGHTPFGHAGQDALNACMRDHGGFEHNLQSLRVVDELEHRYPTFDGLNLCFETREGILKHCARRSALAIAERDPSGVAARFLTGGQPSLEAQLCNLADEIAYNAHDIDDGVRSGLLTLEQVADVPLFGRHWHAVRNEHAGLPQRRALYESLRRMLGEQVHDVVDASAKAIAAASPRDAEAVRACPEGPLIRFGPQMAAASVELKAFLMHRLYRHPSVMATTAQARSVVHDLFACYRDQPDQLPPRYRDREDRMRAIADYIAGMTDRFALREHLRLCGAPAVQPPPLSGGIGP